MKPCEQKSYTDQALTNRKGCMWLDDCRIPYVDEDIPYRDLEKQKSSTGNQVIASQGKEWNGHPIGRCPANLLVSDDVLDDGKSNKGSYSRFFSLDAWTERNLPFLKVPKAHYPKPHANLQLKF